MSTRSRRRRPVVRIEAAMADIEFELTEFAAAADRFRGEDARVAGQMAQWPAQQRWSG